MFDSVGEDWDGEATKVEPSAGQQAEGWEPEQFPPAEYMNWWQNLVYTWILWVTTFFTIDGSDNLTIPAGLTAGADTHVTVSGAGAFKHGDKFKTVAGVEGRFVANPLGGTGACDYPLGGYQGSIRVSTVFAGTPTPSIIFTCALNTGERLKSVTFAALDNGGVTANAIPNVDVITGNVNGTTSTLGGTTAVALTGSLAATTIDVTDTTFSNGRSVVVGFTGAISAGVEIQYVMFTYDRP